MPQLAIRLILASLLAVIAACATAGAGPGDAAADPLVASLQVETRPDSVHLILQVTNVSASSVVLDFPNGQTFDFLVSRGGSEVWRWSADRSFTQALRTESLAPGETRAFDAAWRPAAGTRGDFVAVGRLTARGRAAEQRADFRLP